MIGRTVCAFWLAGLGFAVEAKGQIVFGDMGFVVQSSQGSAGDACWGFTCTPQPLAAATQDTLAVTLRAPLGAPFLVVAAPRATGCAPVPGIWHELIVGPSLFVVYAGRIDTRNTLRFCYDGLATRSLPLPPLPPGTQVAFQAAAVVGTPIQPSTGWALSSAVLVTVR